MAISLLALAQHIVFDALGYTVGALIILALLVVIGRAV